jgi:hypothetical protein
MNLSMVDAGKGMEKTTGCQNSAMMLLARARGGSVM